MYCQLSSILVTSTLLAGISSVLSLSTQSLPACAVDCIVNLIPGSCNEDAQCICDSSSFFDSLGCCVFQACNTTGQQDALTYIHSLCDAAGASSLVPASATCASTSASASASSAISVSATPTASGTASTTPSGSLAAASTSSSGPGVKIGIGVGVPVGVILIAIILAGFLIRRHRRKRREQQQNKGSRPDNGHMEKVQGSKQHLETYCKKPELEAEPIIDPTIRGPVKPKFELQSQETTKAKAISDPRATGEVEAPNTNQPWSHAPGGYMPPELHASPVSEAGTGTLAEQQIKQLKQRQSGVSKTSTSTSTAVVSSSDPSLVQPLQTMSAEASELAEEADMIVQELGLVNLRKKALTTQASAIGKKPEDVEGRKGEEFKELLERETRLKGRLGEIEHQRQGANLLT